MIARAHLGADQPPLDHPDAVPAGRDRHGAHRYDVHTPDALTAAQAAGAVLTSPTPA